LKPAHHITASSADTKGAFNTGFDTDNLRCPTLRAASRASSAPLPLAAAPLMQRRKLNI
jgi:hypothetical protein